MKRLFLTGDEVDFLLSQIKIKDWYNEYHIDTCTHIIPQALFITPSLI